jgi:hypothetical protein
MSRCAAAGLGQPLINVVKHSAISTGQLNTSPCLHFPPIDLVVFQGPSSLRRGNRDLILGGASRLDAFSGYPFRA